MTGSRSLSRKAPAGESRANIIDGEKVKNGGVRWREKESFRTMIAKVIIKSSWLFRLLSQRPRDLTTLRFDGLLFGLPAAEADGVGL